MSRRAFIALTMLALLPATATATAPASAAEDQATARPAVGKPVREAQELFREKKYVEALARLGETDRVRDKTPYETYVVEATRAAIDLDSGDYAAAVIALDAVLASGVLPKAEAAKRILSIAQLEYGLKNYPETVQYAERYYKQGGTDPSARRLMAEGYYLETDYGDAAKTIRELLDAEARAGKPPDEPLMLSLASSEFHLGNQDGYFDALERLVGAYPKPAYWRELCGAVARKKGFSPRLALDLDRLEVAVGALNSPQSYVDATELALERGFPGDAKSFLNAGYAAGMLGKGTAAQRQKRLVDMANHQSNDDLRSLAGEVREAAAAAAGIPLEKLGEAYLSYGRYDDAIRALREALRKGGLKEPGDAELHLGMAYLRAGRLVDARAAFGGLQGGDGAKELARLWLLESRTK